MSDKLTEIRGKIDTLDNKIHDLLMERAGLIMDIAEEKKKTGTQVVHPAREAMMIRRLLGRHKPPLPELAVLSIWRELVGAVCMMQTGLKVVVADNPDLAAHWDMAKNYFGSVLPLSKAASPLMAVASVRDKDASFAVLPWPQEGVDTGESDPWWTYMYQAHEKMRVVVALPYGTEKKTFLANEIKSLVISKIEFLESGQDHSCLILEVGSSVSRARIVEALKKLKIKPLSLHTKSDRNQAEKSLHLLIVEGYINDESKILRQIEALFESENGKCVSAGGYAVPPSLKSVEVNV